MQKACSEAQEEGRAVRDVTNYEEKASSEAQEISRVRKGVGNVVQELGRVG